MQNLLQVGGGTVDRASYLLPRGAADVFFPTDFRMLARMYEAAARAAPTPLAGCPYPRAGTSDLEQPLNAPRAGCQMAL